MPSFLPIPPPNLSFTACGFGYTLPAQPLAVSSSSVAPVFVLAHRLLTPSRFTVSTPSFAFGRACFSLCAPLFSLSRACVSHCLPLVRLGSRVLYTPRIVGRQPSCYRYCRINPPSSGCANPALNPVRFALWTLRDKAAQRRLALR